MNAFATQWLPSYLIPFFTLSYPTVTPKNPDSFPDSAYYKTGIQDACLVITCIAVMAILRDALRLGVLEPLAHWKLTRDLFNRKRLGVAKSEEHTNGHVMTNGVSNGNGHISDDPRPTPKELRKVHRSVLRFAEQGWSVVYYTLQWSFGLYVHRNLPTQVLEPSALWRDYPHIPLAGPVKFYYLTQTAFYLHQVLILNAEARRKDHVQMMTHHIITIFLMTTSYFFNFTRVGCVIMVLMDYCDIFLPLAKMIRYSEISQFACDMTFGWFLVSWLVTRHILFLFIIVSTYRDVPRFIPFRWSAEEGLYSSKTTWTAFVSLLCALQ
ncbi:Sphingosine N-acyltransferase lag1, partial [Termitomyces sp. T112]